MATLLQTITSALALPWLKRSGFRAQMRVLNDYHAFENAFDNLTSHDFLGVPAVLAAVRLVSETCGTLPLHLFQKLDGGKSRREANGHPVGDIFKRPNPSQAQAVFRTTLYFHALCFGRAYAEITRDQNGNAVELLPIHPQSVSLEKDDGYGGFSMYRVEGAGEVSRYIPECNMLTVDGFMGQGLMELCGQSLELTKAAEEFAVTLFQRGCRPGGVLTTPARMSNEAKQRLRRDWESMHSGPANAGRVGILEEGLTWQEVTGTAHEAQTVEQRTFQIREVCRIFGIPPSKLGVEGSNYNSMEQENISFLQNCIQPWLTRFEQEATKKLVANPYQGEFYWAHSIEGLLRADTVSRYKSYAVARNFGFLCPNDIRKLENMDAIPGGDVFLSPLNMQPITPDLGSPGGRLPPGDGEDSLDAGLGGEIPTPVQPTQPAAGVPAHPAAPAAAPTVDVASTALNGAQVASLLEIVTQLAMKQIPAETAKALAHAAFPTLPADIINSIFDPVAAKPAPKPMEPTGQPGEANGPAPGTGGV